MQMISPVPIKSMKNLHTSGPKQYVLRNMYVELTNSKTSNCFFPLIMNAS